MPDKEIIEAVKKAVENGSYINRNLPHKGKIVLDKMTPFLAIFRFSSKKPDDQFVKLVKTQTAFIIAHESLDLTELIRTICRVQIRRYNSLLIVELWEGEGSDYCLYGPKQKAATTMEALVAGLENKSSQVHVYDTFSRSPDHLPTLLSKEEMHKLGVLVLGLKVPRVFGHPTTNEIYYLQFRKFLVSFSEALKKAAFEFSRLQTNAGFDHYWRLGKSKITSTTRAVDTQLAQLSERIDLLLRVTPVNEDEEWENFKKNNFKKRPRFSYRLITIDPEAEKRFLFNIPIDKIEDPTITQIYREKRQALEKELILLEQRETPQFLTMSRNLIGELDDETMNQADRILQETETDPTLDDRIPHIGCHEFYGIARKELDYYEEKMEGVSLESEIRDDMTGLMVSRGRLFIGKNFSIPAIQTEAMLQHEVGTHVLTYCNGKRQPMQLLSRGLANYDELQEGIAVLMEFLADGLTVRRMRTLAARVVAVRALLSGYDFIETFRLLHEKHGFEASTAFNITGRIFRGGGYTKDGIYLKGLLMLMKYLRNGGNLEILFSGKFALEHVKFIDELTHRKIIHPPVLPRIMESDKVKEKISQVRQGMDPLDLITHYHEDSIRS
jgi:uncharacterized protein (TIGR02421 family)